MDARRELLKRQEEHDVYKSAQVENLRKIKAERFPDADALIAGLTHERYRQLLKYIQFLEHINIGTWCDTCERAKTVHADEAAKKIVGADQPTSQKSAVNGTPTNKSNATSNATPNTTPNAAPTSNTYPPLIIDQLRADVASLKTITQALNSRVTAIESTIAAMQKSNHVEYVSADSLFAE